MSDENSPTLRLWAALGVGCVLTLVGVVWLVALTFGDGDSATETVTADRAGPTTTAVAPTAVPPTPLAAASDEAPGPTASPDAAPAPTATISPPAAPTPTVTATAAATTAATTSPEGTPTVSATPSPEPTVAASLPVWGPPVLIDTDLGSGSSEFSAITLNESTNRIMIADDEGRLFEFDLTDDGEPVTPPRHTWQVRVGGGDIEGVAWMFDSTYVLAHENDGRLTVVEIDDDSASIGDEHLVRTIDTGIREQSGNGLEGVAYIADGDIEFVVVDERPPTIVLIDRSGNVTQTLTRNIALADISDVWIDRAGNLVVLSDEGRVVVTMTVDDSGGLIPIDSLELSWDQGRFEQPEGVVGTTDGSRLFVVGEAPGAERFSFGVWQAGG